jgi:hypothetical protein
MSPEIKAIYGKNYKIYMQGSVEDNRSAGLAPEKVANTILQALSASKPKRQYFVVQSSWRLNLYALYKRLVPHQYFYDNFYQNMRKGMGFD